MAASASQHILCITCNNKKERLDLRKRHKEGGLKMKRTEDEEDEDEEDWLIEDEHEVG